MATNDQTVFVTGASGFIARHCILQLLQQGYAVRGSLRSLDRADEVKDALSPQVPTTDLSFVALNLSSDHGWEEALKGCDYLLHVASPFPDSEPEHENDLIIPARDGALRALKAAAKAGVKRTVMTSSIAAIAYGVDRGADYVFDEDDWSDIEGKITPYAKSKTIAEWAAWKFMETPEAGGMELSVINPGAVLGPLLGPNYSTSGEMVLKLLDGSIPACPNIGFSCIDVRDVAAAHLAAMLKPVAAGRRYALIGEYAWMVDVSKVLRDAGYKTPTSSLPNFAVHIMALFDKTARLIKGNLGGKRTISNKRMREELGLEPTSLKDMSVSMAETMVEFGVVEAKRV